MSRRSQSRRRRAYGRRQHEVRERRPSQGDGNGWQTELDPEAHDAWLRDAADDRAALADPYADFGR